MVFQEISGRPNSVSGWEVEIWGRERWKTKPRLGTQAGSQRYDCRGQVIKHWEVLREAFDGQLDVVHMWFWYIWCMFLFVMFLASSEISSLEIWHWHSLKQSIRKARLLWVKAKCEILIPAKYFVYFRISRLEDQNASLWYCHLLWSGIKVVGP